MRVCGGVGKKTVVIAALCSSPFFVLVAFLVAFFFILGVEDHANERPPCSELCEQEIVPVAAKAYETGADRCESLEWSLLAGIGRVESVHGTASGSSLSESGVATPPIFGPPLDGSGVGGNRTPYPARESDRAFGLSGQWQRAMGPMQFMPDTWAEYGVDGDGDGLADPQSLFDSAAAAADLLCEGFDRKDPGRVIYERYNQSWSYVAEVLYWAAQYEKYGSRDEGETRLGDRTRRCLSEFAEEDLELGVVDPRLIRFLNQAEQQFDMCISLFRKGHAKFVINTNRISDHWHGRAVDIYAVNEQLVSPSNGAARALVDWIEQRQGEPDIPDSVGSPWPDAFGFSDALHQGHLHVAFYTADLGDVLSPGGEQGELKAKPTPVSSAEIFKGISMGGAVGSDDLVWQTGGSAGPVVIESPGVVGGFDPTDGLMPVEDSMPRAAPKDPAKEQGTEEAEKMMDLQALVDAAAPGSTLRLEARSYSGARVDKALKIVADGRALIVGEGSSATLDVSARNVVLQNLLVVGGHRGVVVGGGASATLIDVTVANVTDAGVWVAGSGEFAARGVKVTSAGTGLMLWGKAELDDVRVWDISGVGIHVGQRANVGIGATVVVSTGSHRIVVDGLARVRGGWIGASGAGNAIAVSAGAKACVWKTAFWSNAGAAVSNAGVVAEWSNAVAGTAWSGSGTWYHGPGRTNLGFLGTPFINGVEPASTAVRAMNTLEDLRDMELSWPSCTHR